MSKPGWFVVGAMVGAAVSSWALFTCYRNPELIKRLQDAVDELERDRERLFEIAFPPIEVIATRGPAVKAEETVGSP